VLAALALFLTYPALQKGGAWVSTTSAMERGRFTPRACRIDYRLRPCVPSCLALRCSDLEVATLEASASRMAVAGGCCSGHSRRRVGRRRSAGRRLEQETGMRSRLGSLQEAGPPTAGLPAERGSRQSPADRRGVCEGGLAAVLGCVASVRLRQIESSFAASVGGTAEASL
jgi:hypothetical protein